MKDKARILIVDDTPANIKILSELLRGEYRLSVATSGQDALELVAEERPDLILLDIMMPDMDGYEVCQKLKTDAAMSRVPVIFVTAKNEIEDEARGLELGAVDYITKPISPSITLARVRNHLELKQVRDNLEDLVRERTKELRASNELLTWHVAELEGRDQLVQAQFTGEREASAYGKIQGILHEIFAAEKYQISRIQAGDSNLEVVFQCGGNLNPIVTELGNAASQDGAPKLDPELRAAAVPMFHNKKLIGLICVQGLKPEPDLSLQLGSLYRMAQVAAIVLQMSRVADDLLNCSVELDDLLNLG